MMPLDREPRNREKIFIPRSKAIQSPAQFAGRGQLNQTLTASTFFAPIFTGDLQRPPSIVGNTDFQAFTMVMQTAEVDARRLPRRRILDSGMIRHGDLSVCCVIRNFSETGAALDVGQYAFLPDRFALIVVRKKKTYSCSVIWRKGGRIGVTFS